MIHLKKAIIPVLLFTLAFGSFCTFLSLQLRKTEAEPDFLVLSPKLNHFRQNFSNYNTVFLGTSRTFYHILPEAVESAATEAGCSGLKVYNFGVFGLNGAEQDWLLSEILQTDGLQLDHLVIEDPLPAEKKPGEVTTERSRHFHQPELYSSYLEDIFSFPESKPKHLFRTAIFGYGLVYDLSGIGRFSKAVFPPATETTPFSFDFTDAGFEALGSSSNADIEKRRKDFEDNPAQFVQNLEGFEYGAESSSEARADYHIKRLNMISQQGIQAGLFISPDTQELRRTSWIGKAVEDRDTDFSVFNYNLPDQHPSIFERGNWFDFSHLNKDGATLLSQKVGQQLCAERLETKD